MSYEKFLPKPKPPKASITGIMVRPSKELCEFLMNLAEVHGCSVNQLVVAFIKEKYEKAGGVGK